MIQLNLISLKIDTHLLIVILKWVVGRRSNYRVYPPVAIHPNGRDPDFIFVSLLRLAHYYSSIFRFCFVWCSFSNVKLWLVNMVCGQHNCPSLEVRVQPSSPLVWSSNAPLRIEVSLASLASTFQKNACQVHWRSKIVQWIECGCETLLD